MTKEDRDILEDFRARLPLDRFELEKECCEQAIVYDEIGSWVSEVKARAKVAKEHISFVESELSLDIRKNPDNYDLPGKVTEGVVTAAINTHERYRKAFADYVEEDRLANEASTLLLAAEQRKSGIRDLVRLYIHNYYSGQEDVVSTNGWEEGERAIRDMRRNRIVEEDLGEDNSVVEE